MWEALNALFQRVSVTVRVHGLLGVCIVVCSAVATMREEKEEKNQRRGPFFPSPSSDSDEEGDGGESPPVWSRHRAPPPTSDGGSPASPLTSLVSTEILLPSPWRRRAGPDVHYQWGRERGGGGWWRKVAAEIHRNPPFVKHKYKSSEVVRRGRKRRHSKSPDVEPLFFLLLRRIAAEPSWPLQCPIAPRGGGYGSRGCVTSHGVRSRVSAK